jgi:hypothetical protein
MRGERSERMKLEEDRLKRYQDLSFDELATDNRHNFEISYNRIERVELKRNLFESRLRFHLTEKLNGESKVLFILAKNQLPKAGDILKQVLPGKIKTHKK